MYRCTGVEVYICTCVHVNMCSYVPLYWCKWLKVYRFTGYSVYESNIQVQRCTGVQLTGLHLQLACAQLVYKSEV